MTFNSIQRTASFASMRAMSEESKESGGVNTHEEEKQQEESKQILVTALNNSEIEQCY